MTYGINIGFFEKSIDLGKSAELAAKAGFTQLDYTPPLQKENWKTVMKEAAVIFESNGLRVHQTHAPFNRYGAYGSSFRLCLDRCAEATAYLGAKYMVAHGDEFDFENLTFSPEAALEYNRELFLPYVEQSARNGYRVAFETVFEDRSYRRYTSRAEELLALIGSFQSENAVCCWDFGHANIAFGKDAPEVIRRFGPLIRCTHLHDNTGRDSHQLPMTGDIGWKETMEAFHAVGYSGVLSIEYAHGTVPETLAESFLELSYRSAKYLWEL